MKPPKKLMNEQHWLRRLDSGKSVVVSNDSCNKVELDASSRAPLGVPYKIALCSVAAALANRIQLLHALRAIVVHVCGKLGSRPTFGDPIARVSLYASVSPSTSVHPFSNVYVC